MNRLKEFRQAKGMTQAQLASMIKAEVPSASQAVISMLEQGDVYPTEAMMEALSRVLEIPEDEIFNGAEAVFIPAAEIPHSEATMILASVLKFGKKNAQSRPELASLLGWSDRILRKNIERARQEGVVIANDQDGGGYYFPETREELERQFKRNESRAMAILRQQKHLRKALR